MNLFFTLNETVSFPFFIVSANSLKISFVSDKAKKIINIEEDKEIFLSDLLSYEASLDNVITENIRTGETFYLTNHKPVNIENRYKLEDGSLFVAFSLQEEENYFEEIKKESLFKQMLLSLSTDFISMSIDTIDKSINNALKVLGEFSGVDRCYVFRFSDDYKYKSNTHEWCKEGIEPQIENLQNMPLTKFKYNADLFLNGTPLVVNDVNEMPEEAAAEKEEFLAEGIKSVIVLPMIYQNKTVGFIGYDSCAKKRFWTEDCLYSLKIVGDIITGAMIRENAERELKVNEERYRGFFENSGLGIFHTRLDGQILHFNQAFIELFGYENRKEFLPVCTTDHRFKDPDQRWKIAEILKKEGSVTNFDTILLKKGDIEFPARVHAKLINDGVDTFVEGFLEDITERREFENALVLAKDRAEKNDQLKSHFLAQVSHEIRTPINTILSFSQLLAEELKGQVPPDLEYSFSTMDSAGKRIIRTIDLILDMSQIQTDTFELIPKQFDIVDQVIKKLYREYSYLAEEKKLEFKMSVLTAQNEVMADIYTVEQILSNLIHNAIKYTDEGGVEIKANKIDKNFIVEVIDTGIGISEEFFPNLFNTFTQESQGYTRKYEGNGLGLALVKQYCDMNNIQIDVESEKNKGSVFRLTFQENH